MLEFCETVGKTQRQATDASNEQIVTPMTTKKITAMPLLNDKQPAIKSLLTERIPPKILLFFEELLTKFLNARMIIISFLAGVILTGALIFVPVYNQVETLSEPVTLFETILADINRGYVDEVDTNKLFETGISAMLRSLDPYTEFEGKQEAVALTRKY
jgi:hypothetical protein